MQLWEYEIRIIIWKWSSKRRNMISTFLCTCEHRRLGHEDPSRTSFEYHYHDEHPNQQSKFCLFTVLAVIYITVTEVAGPQLNEKNRCLILDSISLSIHSRNNMGPRLIEIGKRIREKWKERKLAFTLSFNWKAAALATLLYKTIFHGFFLFSIMAKGSL